MKKFILIILDNKQPIAAKIFNDLAAAKNYKKKVLKKFPEVEVAILSDKDA